MKCCSRSTLGVIIGGLNILVYMLISIFIISVTTGNSRPNTPNTNNTDLQTNQDSVEKQRDGAAGARTILFSGILSASFLMIILSGMLIMGIVQRRHKLMWPWLALSGISFAGNCIRVACAIVIGAVNGLSLSELLTIFVISGLGIALHALILWPIVNLCRDIREKNKKKPEAPDCPPAYNYVNFSIPEKS